VPEKARLVFFSAPSVRPRGRLNGREIRFISSKTRRSAAFGLRSPALLRSRRMVSERRFHLAQVNIALPREPLDTPLLADFVAALAPVNAAAEASPGFVWRLATEDGDATAVRAFGDERLIVNLSVWESLDALRAFVYSHREHLAALRRRREWFERLGDSSVVLWWVPAGHRPSVDEAEQRLAALRSNGPAPEAFSFRESFAPPPHDGRDERAPNVDPRALCPAGD